MSDMNQNSRLAGYRAFSGKVVTGFPACAKPWQGQSSWLDASAGEGRPSENATTQES
jgi:hypothetical protein